MIPQDKVRDLISKHQILEKELSSGKVEKKKFADKSKEYSDLNDIISSAQQYILFEKEKIDLEKIIKRSRNVSKKLNQGVEYLLKKNNVDIIEGLSLIHI